MSTHPSGSPLPPNRRRAGKRGVDEKKIIGVEQERKTYRIVDRDSEYVYELEMLPISELLLPEADATIQMFQESGFERLKDQSVITFWNEMYRTGKAFEILKPSLVLKSVNGKTDRDSLSGLDPIELVKRHAPPFGQLGEMLADFFSQFAPFMKPSGSLPPSIASN